MSDNIFDYNPTREWNGQVINFGNISLSDNLTLTMVCFDSEGAQQATTQVSTTKYNASTYHEINETIRKFFAGEDLPTVSYTGGELEDAELIYSFFIAGVEIPIYTSSDGHDIFLYRPTPQILRTTGEVDNPVSAIAPGCYVPDHTGPKLSYNDEILCIAAGGEWIVGVDYPVTMSEKGLVGPRGFSTWTDYSTSLDPALTNKPMAHISWSDGATHARCGPSPIWTNQNDCESYNYWVCRAQPSSWTVMMTPIGFQYYNQTATPLVTAIFDWTYYDANYPNQWISPQQDCESQRYAGCWIRHQNYGNAWQWWNVGTSQNDIASCYYEMRNYTYDWYIMWIDPVDTHHQPNSYHTGPNHWWPSAETQDEIMSQIIYASKSIYAHPTEWSSLGTGVYQLDLEYNETATGVPGNSWNPHQMKGRETMIFQVGYELRDTVRDMFICSDGSAKNQADCLAAGECSIAAGNASEAACLALMNDADPPANAGATWTPFNYTWDFDLTQDIRIKRTPIKTYNQLTYGEYQYAAIHMDAHQERNHNDGIVSGLYGYIDNSGGTKIQWSTPQVGVQGSWRTYGHPQKYYVYKSNEYYYGITSPTDYTRGMKHFVGEVPHTTDTGLHYFEEDWDTLLGEGVEKTQPVRYYVTAVWTLTDPLYTTPSSGLHWARYDQGYFNDNLYWFATGNNGYAYTPTSTGTWSTINYYYQNYAQTSYYSYRVYGYYQAVTTGNTNWWMSSDDSSWLWIGSSTQSVADVENNITSYNALINNSGIHPATAKSSYIYMEAGKFYPILIYYGEYQGAWYNQNNEELRVQVQPYGQNWGYPTYSANYYQDVPQLISGGGQPHPQEREGEFPNSVQSSYI